MDSMSRNQRRATAAQQRKRKSFASHIEALHNEAAGVLGVYVISPKDAPRVLLAAYAGNEKAIQIVQLIEYCLHDLDEYKPLCLTCDFEFSANEMPDVFVVIVPDRNDVERGLGMGLCPNCAAGHADKLTEVAQRAVRKIWPSARKLDITFTESVGRA
jgi:hypothetical protein